MHSDEFERAFADFLERKEYDEAEGALFSLVRAAFCAGWRTAGGKALPSQEVLKIVPFEKEK